MNFKQISTRSTFTITNDIVEGAKFLVTEATYDVIDAQAKVQQDAMKPLLTIGDVENADGEDGIKDVIKDVTLDKLTQGDEFEANVDIVKTIKANGAMNNFDLGQFESDLKVAFTRENEDGTKFVDPSWKIAYKTCINDFAQGARDLIDANTPK